jgi:hypothetical protein
VKGGRSFDAVLGRDGSSIASKDLDIAALHRRGIICLGREAK